MTGSASITGASHVYLRRGPGVSFEPDGMLRKGDSVTVLGADGGWAHIRVEDGREGYVNVAFLSRIPPPPQPVAEEPPPVVSATPTAAPRISALAEELGSLREEIQSLRAEVAGLRYAKNDEGLGRNDRRHSVVVAGGTTFDPVEPDTGVQPSVGLLAVGAICLLTGWVLGAALSRRRNRAQHSRLRF